MPYKSRHKTDQSQVGTYRPLDAVDRRLLELIYDKPDISLRDLGEIVGLDHSTVDGRMKKESFKHELSQLRKKFDDKFVRLQGLALDRLKGLIKSNDKKVALKACEIVLQPILNKGQVNLNMNQITFKTRIGPDGGMFQEQVTIDLDSSLQPDSDDGSPVE